jgi:hypothetical protein
LGLRLLDRRTGKWHDYTKRAIGEEVVAALTIAPEGAPDWVSDPDELWNRVEACEKRKDAQVARDYVIPIPLGLTDAKATELARRMARYIADQLQTPVSIGLHRDADVDAFGNRKPSDKQGFHAHLLFPTRRLAAGGDGGAEGEAAALGFGAKLSALSNRRTSSGIVELMNAEWAALSNELTGEAGLTADYDHRSYARLGIERTPQPRLGSGRVAMERKGFFTERGDVVRDIIVMSEVYKQAHTEALAAQHEQAQVDIFREAMAGVPTGAEVAKGSPQEDPLAETAESSLEVELTSARARGQRPGAALADRFVAHSPAPVDEEGRQTLFALSGLVWSIQKALRTLGAVIAHLVGHQEQIRRSSAGDLHDAYELDQARRQRGRAVVQLESYAKDNKWTILAARKLGRGERGLPRRLQELQHERDIQQRAVDDLKRSRKLNAENLASLRAEEQELVERQDRAQSKLEASLMEFRRLDERAVPVLLAVLPDEQRARVEELVEVRRDPPKPLAIPVERPRLALDVPRPRP